MISQQTKVLLVSDNFPPVFGGMARSASRLFRYLQELGYEVKIVSIRQTKETDDNVIYADKGHKDRETLHQLKLLVEKIILNWKPNLLIGFYINYSGYVVTLLGKMYGIPNIVSARGNDLERGLFNPVRTSIVQYAITNCSHMTSVSQYFIDLALAVRENLRYTVVHNGVRINHDFARDRQYNTVGKETRFTIGFFGDDRYKKGLDILVNAMRILALDVFKWKFVVGGKLSQSTKDDLLSEADTFKLKLIGKVNSDKIDKFYSQIHLLVIPSRYEGLPNVLLEAVSRKIPVLVSDNPSLAEYFPEDIVFRFRNDNHMDLANRLQFMRDNYSKIPVDQAFEFLSRNYTEEHEKKKWSMAIDSVISK